MDQVEGVEKLKAGTITTVHDSCGERWYSERHAVHVMELLETYANETIAHIRLRLVGDL